MSKIDFNESGLYQKVGQSIRSRREERRLSQDELADSMGLTRASLSNIELGKQKISLHNLCIICNALGCRLSDVIPTDNEIVDLFNPVVMDLRSEKLLKALSEEQNASD